MPRDPRSSWIIDPPRWADTRGRAWAERVEEFPRAVMGPLGGRRWVPPALLVGFGVPLFLAFLISPQPGLSRAACVGALAVILAVGWLALKVLDVRINRRARMVSEGECAP